jgi:hypothetical protein
MDIDVIERPDPESIVHAVNYSTMYQPFHHLVNQPDPDQSE